MPTPARPVITEAQSDPGPLVSVIIPAYNPPLEAFDATLQSLRASTYSDFQLILVDDGSTDPAFSRRLARCRDEWPALTVARHSANRGLPAARNTGVHHCTTPYFVQLDADDQLAPTFIEKALWVLATHPQWSSCNSWVEGFGARQYQWQGSFSAGSLFRLENCVTSMAMIRRESDQAIGGRDESIRAGGEDWDYWLKMAAHGLWGVTLPEYLLRYRHHASPTVWQNRDDPWQRMRFARALRRRYPGLRRSRFPSAQSSELTPIGDDLPISVRTSALAGPSSILVLVSDMADGPAAAAYRRLTGALAQSPDQYALTLCVTDTTPEMAYAAPAPVTPDFFNWGNFLSPQERPRFLRYLVEARQVAAVIVLASQAGFELLPYLQARFPGLPCLEYACAARPVPSAGPENSLAITLADTREQRDALIASGQSPDRVVFLDSSSRLQALGFLSGRWWNERAAQPASPLLSEILLDYGRRLQNKSAAVAWWQIETPWLRLHRSRWFQLRRGLLRPIAEVCLRWMTDLVGTRTLAHSNTRGPQ